MGIRFGGAVMIALCGWACGRAAAQKAVRRHAALEQTVALLDRITEEIQYRKAPLSGLLAALCRENGFSCLVLSGASTIQRLPAPPALAPAERALYRECFAGLGHGSCAEECRRIGYYRERFAGLAVQAAAAETLAQRIYPRLGLGAGAMTAIALL